MSGKDRVGPIQEYATLRDELSQSKKYVFERPLVIAGTGAALLTAQGVHYGATIPALLAGLLLFNYRFTTNRLRSTARIVAYIQVVLEGDIEWRGWETSLRAYRIWMKDDSKAKIDAIERGLNQKAVPDALMYYPPIYLMHVALVILCLVAGFWMTADGPNAINVAATVSLTSLTAVFARDSWKWRPSKMKYLIERDVVIWQHVLDVEGH